VDPDTRELSVLTLDDGAYVETARLSGSGALSLEHAEPPDVVHLERPFPVDLDLARVFRS
jgi:hypothetical protein